MFRKNQKKPLKEKILVRLFGFRLFTMIKSDRSAIEILQGEKPGQALVLLAVAFFALLAFIGLVTDVGSIYVSYTSLQRAVDAAAVAAANNIKNPSDTYAVRHQRIMESAREMLAMHKISGLADLQVYLCSDEGHK